MSTSTCTPEIADHAAHFVAASHVLSGALKSTSEAKERALNYLSFCEKSLEDAGFLTREIQVHPHPPETPQLIKDQGQIVLIPHKDGSMLKVDMNKCQEIFRSAYSDTWR
ncbi:hypothetical protein [Pseudomonas guariconensis]|uniref:hypothetical protein n=1 Tax=Pseudomonas guariconensis TaxID=1288410 RepID=UPI0018D9EC36|nr:hypothetical protein [Pseudomonas guariconensis]MBH3360458.1 hypothetical protein [Pseudomonas guariconensis]